MRDDIRAPPSCRYISPVFNPVFVKEKNGTKSKSEISGEMVLYNTNVTTFVLKKNNHKRENKEGVCFCVCVDFQRVPSQFWRLTYQSNKNGHVARTSVVFRTNLDHRRPLDAQPKPQLHAHSQ